MSIHDYISYIRRNGQNMDVHVMENNIDFYCGGEETDESNLQINFHELREILEENEEVCEAGCDNGLVITHGYKKGTPFELVEQYFFKSEELKPLFTKIERKVSYSWDEWEFENGYDIRPALETESGIWKLNFDMILSEKLTFEPNPEYDYYALVIDPDSLKYILSEEEDVPFGLLNEIILNHNLEIPENFDKKQTIEYLRNYFKDVSNYLK